MNQLYTLTLAKILTQNLSKITQSQWLKILSWLKIMNKFTHYRKLKWFNFRQRLLKILNYNWLYFVSQRIKIALLDKRTGKTEKFIWVTSHSKQTIKLVSRITSGKFCQEIMNLPSICKTLALHLSYQTRNHCTYCHFS